MKGLILAGGHGTRLRPLTFSGNKHMLPIANQPTLFYGLRDFASAGIRDVGIILGPIQEGIRESIGEGSAFGLRVQFIHQGDPKGLAHAVLCARDFLGDEPFVMYLGDNLLQEGVGGFIRAYEAAHPAAVVGVTPVPHPEQYGIVELEGDRIVSIEEKPSRPRSDLALIGVYLFTPAIHSVIERLRPSKRGELEITEAIWGLVESGQAVLPRRVNGWWKDTGRPEDLLEANELVLRGFADEPPRVEGPVPAGVRIGRGVRIGPGSRIHPGAEIEGPAILGSQVTIGARTRVGPGTALGNGVSLDDVTIRRSIVMEGSRIRGPITLRDCLIGRNVEIQAELDRSQELTLILGDSSRMLRRPGP